MIQANELRLGNWVELDGEITQMVCIMDENTECINPIPLTVEWLAKFNRTVINDKCLVFMDQDGLTLEIRRMRLCTEPVWLSNSVGVAIKYVHQLQNLYFALIGQELKINI